MNAGDNAWPDCSSCGAPLGHDGTDALLICQFCNASTPRPIPEALVPAVKAEPTEPEWVDRWEEEIQELERAQGPRIAKLIAGILLVLVPGVAIAIGGAVSFGINGLVIAAIGSGVLGFVMLVVGILLTVFQGININRAKKEIEKRKQQLREHRN